MPNWHADLYGTVEDSDDTQEAIDALVEEAKNFGMTASITSPEATPEEPPKEPAAKATLTDQKSK